MLAQLDLLSQPCAGVDQAVHDARHSEDTSDDGAGCCYKMIPVGTSARVRGSVGGCCDNIMRPQWHTVSAFSISQDLQETLQRNLMLPYCRDCAEPWTVTFLAQAPISLLQEPCLCKVAWEGDSPSALLLAHKDLQWRQVIGKLGSRDLRGIIRMAVHLSTKTSRPS